MPSRTSTSPLREAQSDRTIRNLKKAVKGLHISHSPDYQAGPPSNAPGLMTGKSVACINASGRQASSFIRVAAAIGWRVRAQLRDRSGVIAEEICDLPNVEIIEGDLDAADSNGIIRDLFKNVQLAFINTTHWGDEVGIGCALANAAKKAGVQHYIYSSMPDHSTFGHGEWKALPMWSRKFDIENHIRQIGLPATFVYTGIYNNNFTSLNYPLFRMELQPDGSFVWKAPFAPHEPLPWLDAEHDVGPAILQIFKGGPRQWKNKRVALAFESLTPKQVCRAFSRGLGRPVRYVRGAISIGVSVPAGYREHLQIVEDVLGKHGAPYFGPELEPDCVRVSRELWEGYRGMEEYAREIFPLEEAANGLTWMDEGEGGKTEVDSENYFASKAI